MRYKVGDKVRIINNKTGYEHRKEYIGQTVTVKSINPNGTSVYNEPHYGVKERIPFIFFESELAPVNTQKIVITSDGVETLARLYDGGKVVKTATAKCSPEDTFVFEEGARIALHRMLGDYAEVKAEKPLKFEVGKRYIGSNAVGGRLVIEITRQACDMNTINHITYYEYKVVEGEDSGSHKFGEGSNFEKRLKPYDPPKYYNGKVVCIRNEIDLTVGKVYEFVDGKLIDDVGEDRPCPNDPRMRTKNLDEGWARGKFIPLVE